ncbi:ThiF family adenylyltransferase [Xanthomonas campestris pv. campestris]|uniref:ThiF family adenylyltransferase n=1 Tax=Xanthomonas campestris TaxID=339 RepID=UPI002AD1DA2B|nr:ThiF family adenylyltransferase [Xanthomonas campestris]MEA0735679.1 ThiF family adenylyltransferase [Xanthomonas campestris pv. campestris]
MASLEYWFLDDISRFKDERAGVSEMASRAQWLDIKGYRLDAGCIVLDFDLDIGHRNYEAMMRYPTTYPHSPPVVRPRDTTARWTNHQFGEGGDLCLEYRPDNWSPEIMGWQVVESAFRLLHGERSTENEHQQVASAHRTTLGQNLRLSISRFPLTAAFHAWLGELPLGSSARGNSIAVLSEQNVVRLVTDLELDGVAWTDPEVPRPLRAECPELPAFVCSLGDGVAFPSVDSYSQFIEQAAALGWQHSDRVMIAIKDGEIRAYSIYADTVYRADPIAPPAGLARLSNEYAQLSSKRVAVVGCGSLGSKVACMLARSGVGDFLLIDDDIFTVENLVRNELDWRDIGLHKAQALSNRIRRINGQAKVAVRRQQLAGQDSPSSAENVLSGMAACDLIIDATASAAASNIIGGLAASSNLAVVWAEVFAGGIGGLVARHRPGVEPSIALMRRAIESWFVSKGERPQPQQTQFYEAVIDGLPWIADDADVTSISAAAARLAIDTLLSRMPSHYLQSIYVIGLAPCEVFSSPFETYPIALPPAPVKQSRPALSGEQMSEQVIFIQGLIGAINTG